MNHLKTRADLAVLLLDIIRPLKKYYSPGCAYLILGQTGVHYGSKSAGMEGFSRILWGLGPLWSQDNRCLTSQLQSEIAQWRQIYQQGFLHGTDPAHHEYWGEVWDYDQKMVEMAAIAITICLAPDVLWKPFNESQQEQIFQWLNQINQKAVHSNNWRFFRILVNLCLRLLGRPWDEECTKQDLDVIEGCYTGEGWYYDGNPGQVYYYIPFAMHFYGLLYAELLKDLEPERSKRLKARAGQFSKDFVYWFADDGSEIPFGRSLTYRFAHSAFFSAMGFAEVPGIGYGVMKHLTLQNIRSWMQKPIFDNAGILTIGYGYPNLFMSERYNACGSPYWSLKAFLLLAMPTEHPFWQAKEQSYPYQPQRYLKSPHMLITHDHNNHVQAFVAGQHCYNHGAIECKYEKFVYSNQFGFSVSRGNDLAAGAFDNTVAISAAGENYFRMRSGVDHYEVTEHQLYQRYHIGRQVEIESMIVPCMSWHVRIHKIDTKEAIEVADGGFSIESERNDKSYIRYKKEMIRQTADGGAECFAVLPWGISGVVSLNGAAELVVPFPNTNLLYPQTILPTVTKRLEAGKHLLVTLVFADRSEQAKELMRVRPKVTIQADMITVTYRDQVVSVNLSEGE